MNVHAKDREVNAMGILLEVCCNSAVDAAAAAKAGADRIELNTALSLGGLTPGVISLLTVKEQTSVPVMVMIRPRDGDFCYSREEFLLMREEAGLLLNLGADGIVFGCLNRDGSVDLEKTRQMVDLAKGRPCVFHRAIDLCPDWKLAMDALITAGITRVLTSGQKPTAPDGAICIREMIRFAGKDLEVLPGSGVRPENAAALIQETGCSQVHFSATRPCLKGPDMNGFPGPYPRVDPGMVRSMRTLLDRLERSPVCTQS